MKVLAIGAHFDDIELGCGGSLLAWKKEGHDLASFVACRSGYRDEKGRLVRSDAVARKEGVAAAGLVGAKLIEGHFATFGLEFTEPLNRVLVRALRRVAPDLALIPWSGDVHHDHQALSLAALHCCRHVPRVLMYCSNWYDGDLRFDPRCFVDISGTLDGKLRLIEMCRSENVRTKGKWLEFVRSQAVLMGLKAGVRYAEGFEVIRWRI